MKKRLEVILEIVTFVMLFALGLMGTYLVIMWNDAYTYWLVTRVAFVYGSICAIVSAAWMSWDSNYSKWAKAEKIFEFSVMSVVLCAVLFVIGMLIGVVINWFLAPPPAL